MIPIRFLVGLVLICLVAPISAHAACSGAGTCVYTDNASLSSPYTLTKQLSPLDYGAKCDGVTDDTTALTNWAAAVTTNSHAVLPNSSCLFTSPIVFPVVNYWTLEGAGEQSQLLYAGATTTGNIVTIGHDTAGHCQVGLQLKNFRVMSNTVMTGGAGLYIRRLCESEITNVRVGADLDGSNSNWYNATQFYNGNSVHVRGYSYVGSNIAEIVSDITDLYQIQGKISHSGIGLNIAGNAGGVFIDQTDILLNGTNVQIDQSQSASYNKGIFFGPSVSIDATSGGAGVGVNVTDTGDPANAQLSFGSMKLGAATNQCLVVATGVAWQIVFSGGQVHSCGSDGIQNNSTSGYIHLGGTYVVGNGGYGINNVAGGNNIDLAGVRFRSNTSGDVSGVGNVIGFNTGRDALITTTSASAVKIGVVPSACGVWAQSANLIPGAPDSGSAGCTYGIGSSSFPFDGIYYTKLLAKGTAPTNSGSCSITSQSGGQTAGKFTASGACAGGTLIFALPTASNGWSCSMHDETTPADAMNETATTTTSATFTGSMANSDVVVFHCIAF